MSEHKDLEWLHCRHEQAEQWSEEGVIKVGKWNEWYMHIHMHVCIECIHTCNISLSFLITIRKRRGWMGPGDLPLAKPYGDPTLTSSGTRHRSAPSSHMMSSQCKPFWSLTLTPNHLSVYMWIWIHEYVSPCTCTNLREHTMSICTFTKSFQIGTRRYKRAVACTMLHISGHRQVVG